MESGQKVTWDCVWFGNYPQTEVVSEDDTAKLTALKNMNTNYETKYETVTSAKFTQIENAAKNADSNGDFVVGSVKYRKIKKTDVTGSWDDDETQYSWTDSSSYHYFKYEPIKWRVLNVENGKALLLADVALDDQQYNTEYTDITWEKSTIRSFLNNYGSSVNTVGNDYSSKGFLNNAFSALERNAIYTTSLTNADNLEYGTEGGNDTSDKIFLLSESDVWSTDTAESHGFVKDYDTHDEARRCKTSTYAFAMGSYRNTSDEYAGNCYWWLRSPGGSPIYNYAARVFINGWGYHYGRDVSLDDGVRPALYLNLSSSNLYTLAGTVSSDGTADETAAPGSGGTDTSDSEKTNEDGRKVETFSGNFKFPSAADESVETTSEIHYEDNYFTESAYEYNHDLTKASLRLAMSAFNTAGGGYPSDSSKKLSYRELLYTKAKNVVKLLWDCGFDTDSITVNQDYLEKPGENTIGVALGRKYIGDYTLIAVAIRGGGYEREWANNFKIYNPDGDNHPGFNQSANRVETAVLNYIHKKNITGKVKFWIVGYSRGAAVANLTAAKLDDLSKTATAFTTSPKDIYAYTFETPRNTKTKNADSNQFYDNIKNIINPIDPVPMVAMKKWGYKRYGVDYYLPAPETDLSYSKWRKEVLKQFNTYMGKTYNDLPHIKGQANILETAVNSVASAAGGDDTQRTMTIAYELQQAMINSVKKKEESLNEVKDIDMLGIALDALLYLPKSKKNVVFSTHYPELCLSWLDVVDPVFQTSNLCEYYIMRINCPVDVYVYKDETTLVAAIKNDVPQDIDGSDIPAYIDEDGQKIICLPTSIDYRVEIDATEEGTMTYSVSKYDATTGQNSNICNTYDVPITKDCEFTSEITTDSKVYSLKDKDGEPIPVSEEISTDENSIYHVQVSSDGSGTVSGDEYKLKGEYAKITATPNDGAIFYGWYQGESLVSKEKEYRFCVKNDVSLTGRFSIIKKDTENSKGEKTNNKNIKITALRLTGISKQIAAGKKIKLSAWYKPANAAKPKLKWTSSNKKVATVTQNGVVTLKKKTGGKSVTITATALDGSGKKATFKIKVMKGVVKKVTIKGKKSVKAGKKLKLKAKVKATKKANKKLIWTSSNTKYATVSAKGVVKTKKAGKGKKVKITAMATDGSGKKATIKIKIK